MAIRKRPSKKAKNGYTYQVYFDKYHYYKSGFKSKSEAIQHEREKLKEFENYGYMSKPVNYTMDQVFNDFYNNSKEYQQTTLDLTRTHYNCFSKKYGYVKIEHVKRPLLQSFFDSRNENGIASNKELKKALNRIFKYAIDKGYITINPMTGVKVSGVTKHFDHGDVLSYDDFKTITDDLKEMNTFTSLCFRMIVITGYYTGLRVSEILALQRKDIDLKNKMIHVRGKLVYSKKDKKEWFISDQLKTETSKATIPIASDLEKELKEWLKFNRKTLVFCDSKGFFISPYSLRHYIKNVTSKHNIKFHMHMLRHTFTTNLVNGGVDIKTAQTLLRHSNANTTLTIYTHITEDQKRKAINDVFKE